MYCLYDSSNSSIRTLKSYRNVSTMVLLSFLLLTMSGLLLIFMSPSPAYGSVSGNISGNNPYATLMQTPNMIAAGGPIPPNWTLVQQEAECVAADNILHGSKRSPHSKISTRIEVTIGSVHNSQDRSLAPTRYMLTNHQPITLLRSR
jgi:hypothetical protein